MYGKGHKQSNTGRTWFKKGHHPVKVFSKGHIPWNKKEPVRKVCLICKTPFIVKPYRINTAQYCSTKCQHASLVGNKPWNKGVSATLEHRKKMSLARIGVEPWNKGKHPKYMQGKNHPMWKGGKSINDGGYILIYAPNHPFKCNRGCVREHRLVIEKQIGRYLKPQEMVHHINGIKTDNRPENLMVFTNRIYHVKFEANKFVPKSQIVFDGRRISQ